MAEVLTEDAPAKINLYLHVVGRRPDGYHLLDSLVVFAGVGDRLRAVAAAALSLDVTGPLAADLLGESARGESDRRKTDNLVLRAARALAVEVGVVPTGRITLEKHLPVAAGIGGGSADAAAALRLLVRLWGVEVAAARLDRVALSLGADVPVCLGGRAARMGGIGERLLPAPKLPAAGIVLVNPGVGVATPAVFGARTGGFSGVVELPEGWADAGALAEDLRETGNDLQSPARQLAPVIGDVLGALAADPGCLLARMSGSGATCFGLYRSAGAAEAAAAGLRRDGWWVWGGAMGRA